MADYVDLYAIISDDTLRQRVTVATIIAAEALIAGSPTAGEQSWAAEAFDNPRGEGLKALRGVLAVNNAATIANIQGATDAQIQTNVDAIVPSLVVAFNA